MLEQESAAGTRSDCAHNCMRLISTCDLSDFHFIGFSSSVCTKHRSGGSVSSSRRFQEVGVAAHKRPRGRVRVVEVQHQRVDALQVRLGRPRPVVVRREPTPAPATVSARATVQLTAPTQIYID